MSIGGNEKNIFQQISLRVPEHEKSVNIIYTLEKSVTIWLFKEFFNIFRVFLNLEEFFPYTSSEEVEVSEKNVPY